MTADTATRSDLDVLTTLNSDYIHSVQHGDVQRFDDILAEDFLCSNPDGSLVDKSQFLAQNARPVTISGLSAQEVRVRILGDVAIIHARTSYTTADGAAERPLYRCMGAPGRKVARGIRACDAVAAVSKPFRRRYLATLGAYWCTGCDRRQDSRHTYSEGFRSGIGAPQPSVSSRQADCQFRVTTS
jgi:hypothetical protein